MTEASSGPPSSTSEISRATARLCPSRARSINSVAFKRDASGFDRDDLSDAGHPLLQDPLDALSQRHGGHRATAAGPEQLNRDGAAFYPFELDVAAVHLDRGTDQLQGFADLFFDGRGLAHDVILPAPRS